MKTLLNRVEKVEMLNDFNKLQNEDKSVCMLADESYERANGNNVKGKRKLC